MKILVIDDDTALCRSLQIQLEGEGHAIATAYTAESGLREIAALDPDLVFVDLKLPDKPGLEVLKALHQSGNRALPVMITSVQDARATIEAVRLGAFDYIRKPLDFDAVLVTIEKAAQHLRRARPALAAAVSDIETSPHEIVGAHPSIIEVLKQIALLSTNRVAVLVVGESGTGKELVARALHEASFPGQPFVAVNCSAVVPTLLESELFGHERGAFTGAERAKAGKLELAKAGTLFLDEIGDMSIDLQAKLLRVLQEREFERVGSTTAIPFNARIVAATHRDLDAMVADHAFREDLYYRLAVSTIRVPPLRDRRSDLPLLVDRILGRLNRDLHKSFRGVERRVLTHLEQYDWPGNIRELVNVLTRAALLARGPVLCGDDLLAAMGQSTPMAVAPEGVRSLRDVERDHIEKALALLGWNIKRTAEVLGITRVTLRKKIEEYGLVRPAG